MAEPAPSEKPADAPLLSTPLQAEHEAQGARMVPFAGYAMPVQYPTGILAEHAWTREHAGLFDVSHMGQLEARGPGAHAYLQARLSNDLDKIGAGQAQYTLLTNEAGGNVMEVTHNRLSPQVG